MCQTLSLVFSCWFPFGFRKFWFGFLKILSLVFFLHVLVFLWVFKVFLSFPCVLILKFLSLVFLGVFPPKFSKTRSIRSKNFKSCAILLFFSLLFKFKNIFSLYFKANFQNLPLKFRYLFQNLTLCYEVCMSEIY